MFERTTTVGNVAALLPQAMDYFKEIGIDYCCGGNRILTEVLHEKGQDAESVFSRLNELEQEAIKQGGFQDFQAMSAKELSELIVTVHHTYLRRVLPQIGELLNAVMRAHGANHPELFHVGRLFGTLRGDLEQHLIKEELFLFPALQHGDSEKQAAGLTPEIISEHEHAGEILEQIKEITQHYTVPGDACVTYEKVYHMLNEMEDDLHRHIHLENNILLKKYDVRTKG